MKARWRGRSCTDIRSRLTPKTFLRIYSVDTTKRYNINFFVHGEEWSFYGLFKTDIRLFGVDAPGTIFLLGTDRFGQDMWSRVLAGTQVTLSVGLIGVIISVLLGARARYTVRVLRRHGRHAPAALHRVLAVVPQYTAVADAGGGAAADLGRRCGSTIGIVTILAFLGWTGHGPRSTRQGADHARRRIHDGSQGRGGIQLVHHPSAHDTQCTEPHHRRSDAGSARHDPGRVVLELPGAGYPAADDEPGRPAAGSAECAQHRQLSLAIHGRRS